MRQPIVLALVALVTLTGCGGGNDDGPAGYLARADDGAMFIQWTRTEDSVTGSIAIAQVVALGPLSPLNAVGEVHIGKAGYSEIDKRSLSFTGVISGDSVTLTIDQGLGSKTNWTGTLADDELVLSYPAEDGTLTTLHFAPAGLQDYNSAVLALQKRIAVANADQAQRDRDAAAAEAARRDVARRQTAILDSADALRGELAALAGSVQAASDSLASVGDSLATETDSVTTTLNALRTARTASSYDKCYQADQVDYYADQVAYYRDQVGYYLDEVNGRLAEVKQARAQVNTKAAQLRAAQAALRSYRPPGLPATAQVSQAIAAADSKRADIVATARTHREKANRMVTTARGYATQADPLCRE